MAALNVKGTDKTAVTVAEKILSHANQTGGKFLFSEEIDDSYNRILATPLRANAAILSAFLRLSEKPFGKGLASDVPFKLVRAITQGRGSRNHWENTQENMFCMNALVEYSKVYEKTTPDMAVTAKEGDALLGKTAFKALTDPSVSFEKPLTEADKGAKKTLLIEKKGDGRLYYASRLSYAPLMDAAERINSGIDIRKEVSVEKEDAWQLLQKDAVLKRGDIVRVDIYLSLPAARHFVVVNDPVPGGFEPVNRDLATASVIDADKGDYPTSGGAYWFRFSDWISYGVSRWSFYHQELRHDRVVYYSDYLPAGNYHLSYSAQVVAEGKFTAQPVHAEEMYDPDVFGKGLPGLVRVGGE